MEFLNNPAIPYVLSGAAVLAGIAACYVVFKPEKDSRVKKLTDD